MKIIPLLTLMLCFISCNSPKKDNAKNKATQAQTTTQEKSKNKTENKLLKQNGNYSQLFEREARDCSFVSAEIIAKALNISIENIKTTENSCTYNLVEKNGKKTRLYFKIEPWKNKTILKEIRTAKENAEIFGKDSKLSQYRVSNTGDTYLSMHQNRMIRILNEAQNTAIILFYTPVTDPSDTNYEKKDMLKNQARKRAYAISNFLLEKYQN